MTLRMIWRFTQMYWRDCHARGTFLAAELRGIFANGDFNFTCSQSSRHSPANPASYANTHQKMEGIHWAIFLAYSCINQTAVSSSDSLWTHSPFPWVHHAKTARLPGRSLETRLPLYIGAIYPELIDGMLPPSSIWSMLTMTAPAWVIWIYARASYWPGQMRKWVGVVCAFCWIMSSWKSLAINKFYLQSPIWNCH